MVAALSQVHHNIDERRLIAISFCIQRFIVLGQNVFVELSKIQNDKTAHLSILQK